jgi:hypothetical protein
LSDVASIALRVKDMENKLEAAQTKARLFNSREGIESRFIDSFIILVKNMLVVALFEQDVTDYEDLTRIQKAFEPYSNLWQTAKDWLEYSEMWTNSKFVDLNAEVRKPV